MRVVPLIFAILMLAACGGRATDDSGATPSESRQLNEAAASLDNSAVAIDSADDTDNAADPQ